MWQELLRARKVTGRGFLGAPGSTVVMLARSRTVAYRTLSRRRTAKIDEMAALLRCCIDLSRGRRAALITAAVLEQLDIGAAEVAA